MSEIALSPVFPVNEQRIIRRALRLLEKYQRLPGESFTSTSFTKTWLQLQMAGLEREFLSSCTSITSIVCWSVKRCLPARSAIRRYIPAKWSKRLYAITPLRSFWPTTIHPAKRSPAKQIGTSQSG